CSGLFAGALRYDAGGGSHLRSGGAYGTGTHVHFANHLVELASHLGHRPEQAPDLIAAVHVDGPGQVTGADILDHVDHFLDRLSDSARDYECDEYAREI